MTDWTHDEMKRVLIRRLIAETGITEADAAILVETIGPQWSSLVREARIITKPR